MSRIILAIIAIPLLLVIAAAILIPLLVDKDKILELAAAQVEQQTGATLRVAGEVGLTVFPTLGVSLADVSLDMPDEQQPSLRARGLDIAVQVMPLLSGTVAIDGIILDGVIVKMVTEPDPAPVDTSRMNDRELQAFYARRQAEREAAGQSAGTGSALAVPLALNVQRLEVTDSRLEVTEAGGATTVVELRRLEGRDLNLDGRAIPLEADIVLAGEEPLTIALAGSVVVNADTMIVGLEGLDVELTGAAPERISLKTSGQVDINRQVADLKLEASIAETRAEGELRYAGFESPQIDTQLRMNLFNPAIFAVAGPEAAATSGTQDEPVESGDIPLPLDALRVMDTRASLTIDKLLLAPHEVQDLDVKLRVANGNARLQKVTGRVHGGELEMNGTLDASRALARFDTTGSLEGVDIAQVLAALESEPLMTGAADLGWTLQGAGNSSEALIDSLAGPIRLLARDAILRDMSVEQMMCEAVALVNQETPRPACSSDHAVPSGSSLVSCHM